MAVSISAFSKALKEVYGLSERHYAELNLIRRYWDKLSYRHHARAKQLEKLAGKDPDSPFCRVIDFIQRPSPLLALIKGKK